MILISMSVMIPRPKPEEVISGTRFMELIRGKSQSEIEQIVLQQIFRGNVPDFVRRENFREVTTTARIDGITVQATFRVSPDYLAIGTNDNYVRVPLSPLIAQRIAQYFACVLPTRHIVDLIDQEARKNNGSQQFYAAPKLAEKITNPRTNRSVLAGENDLPWNNKKYGAYEGRWMQSSEFFELQSRLVDSDLSASRVLQPIRSGHKKDVVYHPEAQARGNVAIYHPKIQGLNWVRHEDTYVDYSHGIRLVDATATITFIENDESMHTERRSVADILSGAGQPPYNHLYTLFSDIPMDITSMYRRDPAQQAQSRTAVPSSPIPHRTAPTRKRSPIRLDEIEIR